MAPLFLFPAGALLAREAARRPDEWGHAYVAGACRGAGDGGPVSSTSFQISTSYDSGRKSVPTTKVMSATTIG